MMIRDIDEILIDRQAIAQRVAKLAQAIVDDLPQAASGEPVALTLVPVLTGSVIFLADLIRQMPVHMQIHLISVSSYPGPTTRCGEAELDPALTNLPPSLAGAHVLIVDDILDSGGTLGLVRQVLRPRGPASLRSCVLLRKDRPEAMACPVDYVAFDIPDRFVVGYGLDYDDYYRNLPDIVTLCSHVFDQADLGDTSLKAR